MDYYVFDCNYVCHKARFTVGSLSHKGQPTGVIYGFLSQVLNVAESFNSSDLLFTWDSKKSFRKQVFPGYKKTRKKNLSEQERKELYEAYEQMEIIYENILPAIGFNNNYKQVGIEGDDIMAELVLNPKNKVHRFNLIASDQDLYQLLSNRCRMIQGKGADRMDVYTEKKFIEEYGITPKQWIEVKKINGCSSDEVPNCGRDKDDPEVIIARIGEKTTIQYLQGTLKPTTKAFMRIDSVEGKELAKFNEQLVKLPHSRTKEIEIKEDELNIEAFKEICKQYGFKEFLYERMDEWERLFNGEYE